MNICHVHFTQDPVKPVNLLLTHLASSKTISDPSQEVEISQYETDEEKAPIQESNKGIYFHFYQVDWKDLVKLKLLSLSKDQSHSVLILRF